MGIAINMCDRFFKIHPANHQKVLTEHHFSQNSFAWKVHRVMWPIVKLISAINKVHEQNSTKTFQLLRIVQKLNRTWYLMCCTLKINILHESHLYKYELKNISTSSIQNQLSTKKLKRSSYQNPVFLKITFYCIMLNLLHMKNTLIV